MNPIYLVRFDKEADERLVDTLVAFVSSAALDAAALASAVTKEAEKNLAPDELIVLVRESSTQDAIDAMQGREMSALSSRLLGRTSITLLGYGSEGEQVLRDDISSGGMTSGVELDEILRRGATSIFREHGGFIEPNASYHFANPSGRHTDRFIRLSNILVRQAEIAFLAVAVMSKIPGNVSQAYVDTPALYAVVSAINEQWRTLAPTRPQLAADNFRSYAGLEKYPFSNVQDSVAIISASSSGGLAEKLVNLGFAPESIVHVLYLGSGVDGLRVAVDLRHDANENPRGYEYNREIYEPDECKMCARGSVAIPLRGDQFDIQGPQPEPLIMRQADSPKGLGKLMSRLAGTGTFGVSSGRRQYSVDAGHLISSSGFLERLDFYVRRHVPGGVRHCIIDDEASRSFAERIKAINGSSMTIHDRNAIEAIGAPADEMVESVLVVASVIGSGRTLLEISRDLRNVCPKAPIVYLVGLGKVVSDERLDLLRRTLVQSPHHVPHLLEIVEELILPGPPTANAWKEELGLLQETRDHWPIEYRATLQVRLDRLLNASLPLTDDLFVANDGKATLKLQEGFAFWPKVYENNSQADVFYTMSSVLQKLRTAPISASEHALRTNWLQQTLLSPENFGRFNDGIIQASILRGARPAELDYRDDISVSAEAARIVRRIILAADRARGEAATEFLIALATGRLRVRNDHLKELLADLPKGKTLVHAALDLARLRLLA
jgi:hypothetical protein